jgi:hypothetical protein
MRCNGRHHDGEAVVFGALALVDGESKGTFSILGVVVRS